MNRNVKQILKYDVIIATKDRLKDLLIFLDSLLKQTILPDNLIIIDASRFETRLNDEYINKILKSNINFIYKKSSPGLTHQRNLGCSFINEAANIVFFFDDDIILSDKKYIETILERFAYDEDKKIASIFGKIINPKKYNKAPNESFFLIINALIGALTRIFILNSSNVYKVLVSGMNVSNQYKVNTECYVSWQPGCCMSFRKEILTKYSFDESLIGYSMREDLDISYRISKEYKILYLPYISLLHNESQIQRLNAINFGEADIESWHWFVNKNLHYVKNKICFYWGLTGYLILLLLSSIIFNDKNAYYRFKGGLKALFRILRIL